MSPHGLLPVQCLANPCNNVDLLSTGLLRTNFSVIWIKTQLTFPPARVRYLGFPKSRTPPGLVIQKYGNHYTIIDLYSRSTIWSLHHYRSCVIIIIVIINITLCLLFSLCLFIYLISEHTSDDIYHLGFCQFVEGWNELTSETAATMAGFLHSISWVNIHLKTRLSFGKICTTRTGENCPS